MERRCPVTLPRSGDEKDPGPVQDLLSCDVGSYLYYGLEGNKSLACGSLSTIKSTR